MRIDLVARAGRSRVREASAPILAFAAAILIGGAVIAATGRSPSTAFTTHLVEPLTRSYMLQSIAAKATPLVLIGVGLSFCYRANYWA